ncbi:MAG: hypothetical protein WCQ59_06365 [Candidatus Cloacimonadaceae bacterium]
MMTSDGLYLLFYGWITASVATTTPVIPTHDNGTPPVGTYLAIQIDDNWDSVGRPAYMSSDPAEIEPVLRDYKVDLQIWETNGDGSLLLLILEALDTYEAQELFAASGVSVLTHEGPTAMPRLQESQWKHENMMTLHLAVARGDSGNANYIEHVEFVNNLGGV